MLGLYSSYVGGPPAIASQSPINKFTEVFFSNIKLQMDPMSTETTLQGRDHDQKLRNNSL